MIESKTPIVNLKRQTIQEIVRYIRTEKLPDNNKLPREEEFCKILGISRVTLRTALDELEAYGIIIRKHGKGTFANPCSLDMKVSFNPVMDFYDMIRLSGYAPSIKLLECYIEEVSEELAKMFKISAGQPVLVTKKIFYADGRFCAYIEDVVNINLLEIPFNTNLHHFDKSLFRLLNEEFNIQVTWDKVEIDAVLGRSIPAVSKLIDQGIHRDGALLLLRGVSYDTNGNPVLFGKEYIDTSIISFSQIRKKQPSIWPREE